MLVKFCMEDLKTNGYKRFFKKMFSSVWVKNKNKKLPQNFRI